MNKNNRVHLEIQTHRKNPIGVIRSTYRDDSNSIKHQTVSRITGLDLMQLKMIQAALQNNVMLKSDFQVVSSREYGASYAVYSLAKELNLDKIISSRTGEAWVKDSIAMIVGRLVYAGSKLSLSHCASFSALWEICGNPDEEIDVDTHCYESMDKLLARQENIQKALVKRHLTEGSLVLYDITSSYLEGEYKNSELVEFGYNRDRKRGHEQIVIGLLCNKDGCPVAVEVFAGNTKDETTVLNKIKELQKKYGIESVIFVGDRGMVTQAKYEKIDHNTVKVISALTHDNIRDLCEKGVVQLGLFDENSVVELYDGNMRYCLCKNPQMTEKETKTRRALLDKTAAELNKVTGSTRKCKNSKEIRAGKVVNKYEMGKFVLFHGTGNDLKWSFDQEKIDQEQLLDGCYIIYTDICKDEMTAIETVKNYKSLISVEQAFRCLKTTQLEIRPIYHKRDDRIKCHVFLCMLAYYLMWHMKQRLQPLFNEDGAGKDRKYTFKYIIESLKSIRSELISIESQTASVISTPSDEQLKILSLLKIAL